ncbi:hypothetical protein [Neobacillus drentensis]|uniref:hypothetical protein n=1 Tax=Neobacillus drentensis TaxID=220684 RepID=UPI002FFF9178
MVAVIFIGNMTFCPYAERYIEILEDNNCDYEVLYWNRSNTETDMPSNYISYNVQSNLNRNKVKKVKDFYGYYMWLKNVMKEKKYDRLILLSTLSGFIVLPQLLKRYKKRYIFDIRDYSYENNKFYYLIEEKIIKNSDFTSISSMEFKKFLPPSNDYVITHNFNPNEIKELYKFKKKSVGDVLNFVWIGSVRYFEYQKIILDSLGNDRRFKVFYHGTGPQLQEYKEYVEKQNYSNVYFTGKYNNVDKADLLKHADIINNAYGKKNDIAIKHAVSNKYYDGIIYGIPQIVEIDSFKEKLLKDNNLGLPIDNNDKNLADLIYE